MRKPAPFMLRWSTNTSGPHNDIHLHLCCHRADTSSQLPWYKLAIPRLPGMYREYTKQ